MFGVSQTDLQYKRIDGRNMVDSIISPPLSRWAGISRIIGLNPLYYKSRVWHLEDKNRLLGVKMSGKQPIDLALFEQICGLYNST